MIDLSALLLLSLSSISHGFSTLDKPAIQTKTRPDEVRKSPPQEPLNEPEKRKRSFLQKLDQFLTRNFQDPTIHLNEHTYLTGNYAPVAEEHTMAPVTVVEGRLPPNLDGMFCRNGPNPIEHNAFRKRYHWFDGAGMLHNLRIQEGEAWYTNQYVPSIHYEVEKELGEDFFPRLGEYEGLVGFLKILFHIPMVRERVSNLLTVAPPNTNVIMFNNKFYCLHEANLPFEIRLQEDGTSRAVGYESFQGALDYPISAHPRICPQTKDLIFHSYSVNQELIEENGIMKVGRYDGNEIASYFVPIESKDYVSFAHGMIHSEHYTIVWDCSVHFEPKALFDGGSYFRSNLDYPLRFGLIHKDAKSREDVIWINTKQPGAIVHPLNAWEEDDGTIVLWTPLCEDLDLNLETEEINQFNMAEFRLSPKTGLSSRTIVDDTVNIEFSVLPPEEMGRFTRYGYTAIQDKETPGEGSFAGFCIWDFVNRKPKAIYYNKDEVGGEPMVSKDSVTGKTYVGTYLFNLKTEQSFFALYDGQSGELVARLKMPYRVPFGFHGQWISGQELRNHFSFHELKELRKTYVESSI